jgi:hypothetical protein
MIRGNEGGMTSMAWSKYAGFVDKASDEALGRLQHKMNAVAYAPKGQHSEKAVIVAKQALDLINGESLYRWDHR